MVNKSSKVKITTPVSRLKPTAGYVLIEPLEAEKKTVSGIYLPESNNEKPQKGKVLSTGSSIYSDGREIVSPVKVNDIVVYKKWGGNEIKVDNKELLLVKFEDVLAIEI